MLIPKITTYSTQIIPTMYQEGWRLITIYDDKMFWEKEEKRTRKQSLQVAGDDFEEFWNLYPKERRKMKKQAKEVWARLDEKTKTLAIDGLKRYKVYWKRTNQDMNFAPTAYYWLKGERYTDEGLDTPSTNPVVDKIKDEMEEDRKHREEKERIDRMIYNLRQDPIKWKEVYDKAKSQIPPAQLNFAPNIVESLILTRIKINLNN